MSDYLLSRAARHDVHGIWEYIARDSVRRADRFRDRLFAAMRKLAEMPTIGHIHEFLADETLRVWPVGTYVIIYRPETQPLQIVRVVSGFQDITALFPAI